MDEIIVFVIASLVGVSMVLKPDFVLFRPSRKGNWLANLLGEKNWLMFIRIFGAIIAVFSAITVYGSIIN